MVLGLRPSNHITWEIDWRKIFTFKKSKIGKGAEDNVLLIHSFYYSFLITNDYNYTFKGCDNNSNVTRQHNLWGGAIKFSSVGVVHDIVPLFIVTVRCTTLYEITTIPSVPIHTTYETRYGHHRIFPYSHVEQVFRVPLHLINRKPPPSDRSRVSYLDHRTEASESIFMYVARTKVVLSFLRST